MVIHLTPVVGYISKFESESGKTKVNGIKGFRKRNNKVLNQSKMVFYKEIEMFYHISHLIKFYY